MAYELLKWIAMKSNIYIAFAVVGVFVLSACGGYKSNRIPITRGTAATSAQQKEMANFQARSGCLNLEAVADFYKKSGDSRLARISVRDIVVGKADSSALLPALLKARPLEIQIDSAPTLVDRFPLKIVTQNDCTSVEMVDENGKTQTFQVLKNRVVAVKQAVRPEPNRARPTSKMRQAPISTATKSQPKSISQNAISEYLPQTLLLQGQNGEKWIYRFNVTTKNLEIRLYQTLQNVKNCTALSGARVQEVYDVVLLSDRADSVRISTDVLTALKTLGVAVPEKPAPKNTATKYQKQTRRNNNQDLQKSSEQLTTDQYLYISNQLSSDKIKTPACGGN